MHYEEYLRLKIQTFMLEKLQTAWNVTRSILKSNCTFISFCLLLLYSLSTFYLQGCGGQSSRTLNNGNTVSGRAVLNSISNAKVSAYKIKSNGRKGSLISTSSTNANGEFSLIFGADFNDPFEMEVAGGSYIDEATGQIVNLLDTQKLKALVPKGISNEDVVIVSALTHVATLQAVVLIEKGNDISSAINQANEYVADKFRLGGVDLVKTDPDNLTDPDDTHEPGSPQTRYGLTLASLSQQLVDEGKSPLYMLDRLNFIKNDLSDAKVSYSTQKAIDNIESAADNFLKGARNATSFTSYQEATTPLVLIGLFKN